MQVLFLTTMYPAYPEQPKNQVPFVVHYLAWELAKSIPVQSVRLWAHYPGILKFLDRHQLFKYADEADFMLDGVQVLRWPVRILPKIGYLSHALVKAGAGLGIRLGSKGKFDAVICDILNPAIYAGAAFARQTGAKLIASLHNTDIRYLKKPANAKRFAQIAPQIDHVLLRSHKVRRDFEKLSLPGLENAKIHYMPFGIEAHVIADKAVIEQKARRENAVIMTACRLIPLKNVDILIEAFSAQANPDLELWILGDGPQKEALLSKADQVGCGSRIHFLGDVSRDMVIERMRLADVFVMVSSPETFGLVYIEAMANGCLTIGARGEGIDGVIQHGENGFLCDHGDSGKLAKVLQEAISLSGSRKADILSRAHEDARQHTLGILSNHLLEIITDCA